jgi:DNA-binding PadR family transcriptional regulator
MERAAESTWPGTPHSRFELAPPRRFLLPAVLLLLEEEPAYGYHLAKGLEELRFGRVDRPSVYRALAQLERDGLVEAWSDPPKAGQARRVYGLTEDGRRALRAWMGVVKQDRDCLDLVLRRYVATGTVDAALAEAEGGWAAVTGHAWSPVSSTSRIERRRAHLRPTPVECGRDELSRPAGMSTPAVFTVDPDRSVVLIEARSSVGPITFGAVGVTGRIEAALQDDAVQADSVRSAHLEIEVGRLRSGNALHDAELLRRIDARRHPTVSLELRTCRPAGAAGRYHIDGEITFHGSTRLLEGIVGVSVGPDRKLVVSGEQVIDIRDFDIDSPTVLMLRIYPDVVVQLHVEAACDPSPQPADR